MEGVEPCESKRRRSRSERSAGGAAAQGDDLAALRSRWAVLAEIGSGGWELRVEAGHAGRKPKRRPETKAPAGNQSAGRKPKRRPKLEHESLTERLKGDDLGRKTQQRTTSSTRKVATEIRSGLLHAWRDPTVGAVGEHSFAVSSSRLA